MLLAAPAGVFDPLVHQHLERRRHVFELLARFAPDLDPLLAAAGAGPLALRDLMPHHFPRQMIGEPAAAVARAFRLRVRLFRLPLGQFRFPLFLLPGFQVVFVGQK